MQQKQKSAKPALLIAAGVVLLGALAGGIGIKKAILYKTKQDALSTMRVMADDRTQLIRDFVHDTGQKLLDYSESEQITALLRDQENSELVARAQEYTESYSQDIVDLDGIYASNCDTVVLTHTKRECRGIQTRADPNKRCALFEALASADGGLYNAGIIISPAIFRQCLCMYRAVSDDKGSTLGFTGINVETVSLTEKLAVPSVKGTRNAGCYMVNIADTKYVFNPDEEQLGKAAENAQISRLCNAFSGRDKPASGTLDAQDGHIAAYSYMPEYGWLLWIGADV